MTMQTAGRAGKEELDNAVTEACQIPQGAKRPFERQGYPRQSGNYGDFGLVALEPAWITSNQIEAARIAMTRYIKRGGQVWIKIFPDKPITEKPAETRMGSGKGSPEYWVAVVKPGRVMFEIAGVDEELAREAMRLAANKLPIKCKFVTKEETGGEQ